MREQPTYPYGRALGCPNTLRGRTVEGHLLVLVAHTIRDDEEDGRPIEVIRIISARRADRKERQCYEQESR
jgi:uncharacterized DUF497 family protein